MSQSEGNVQTNPPTKLQYAEDDATVVPVNDTRTQCTTVLVHDVGEASLKTGSTTS